MRELYHRDPARPDGWRNRSTNASHLWLSRYGWITRSDDRLSTTWLAMAIDKELISQSVWGGELQPASIRVLLPGPDWILPKEERDKYQPFDPKAVARILRGPLNRRYRKAARVKDGVAAGSG